MGEDVVVGERGGLHRTHLVVREDEVGAAALDVERVAEPVSGDRRALDVPARSPGTEHLVLPRRLPVTHGAPQERVERVALAHPVGVATAIGEDGHHLLPGPARDRPERRGLGQVEVDVLAGTLGGRDRQPVCRAAGEEGPHLRGDLGHRLDDADEGSRRDDREGCHVLAEQADLGSGELAPVASVPGSALQEWVVDVGDVLHVVHLVSRVAQRAAHEVERDVGRGVTEVCRVVGRDPTDVQACHRAGIHGTHRPALGVVEVEGVARAGDGRNEGGGPGLHRVSLDGERHSAGHGMAGHPGVGSG